MGLAEYHRKRDFRKTAEPRGDKPRKRSGQSYVVQKHAASRLHYDFRLELGGTLKSWAVPKGPSLDPAQKRLAMHVEDHPVEYGGFEGIIPAGEYGGGTVMLWDRGQWEPVEDPEEGYRNGALKLDLHGEKLKGRWMLVRRGGRKSTNETEKTWWLFKERDEHARTEGDADILEESPLSVASERDLDEIASQQDRVWGSKPKAAAKTKTPRQPAVKSAKSARPPSKATKTAARKITKSAVQKKAKPGLKKKARSTSKR